MTKKTNTTCPNCGSSMRYSPSKEGLYCKNCQYHQEIEAKEITLKKPFDFNQKEILAEDLFGKKSVNLHCPNCGANVVLNKFEISQKCPYCSTSLVIQDGNSAGMSPDAIIPFAFDEAEAKRP